MSKKSTHKSVLAVVAGVAVIVAGSTAVDVLLHMLDFYPTLGQPMNNTHALVATAYRTAISVGGAYLTAHLAPQNGPQHALWLGVVGTLLGAMGAAATWNQDLGPHWYPVALAVLAVPQCWLGGRLQSAPKGARS